MEQTIMLILTAIATFGGNMLYTTYVSRRNSAKLYKDLHLIKEKNDGIHVPLIALEDFDFDQEVIMEVFETFKNSSTIFANEKEFLDKITSEPSVYVIDEKLNQIDGFEIYKVIMRNNPDNFFILNTGSQNDEVLAKYIEIAIANGWSLKYLYKQNRDHKLKLRQAVHTGILTIANR